MAELVFRNSNFAGSDLFRNVLRGAAINGATDGEGGSEDFSNGSLEFLGQRLEAHLSGDFNDLIEGNISIVLNVLF